MPRNITAQASKFARTRPVVCDFPRGDQCTLTANFNAVLAVGATIASATWRAMNNGSVIFGVPTNSDRAASVLCTMGWGAGSLVKCTVTASNGEVFSQLFAVGVTAAPWFQGETVPAQGSTSVTVP